MGYSKKTIEKRRKLINNKEYAKRDKETRYLLEKNIEEHPDWPARKIRYKFRIETGVDYADQTIRNVRNKIKEIHKTGKASVYIVTDKILTKAIQNSEKYPIDKEAAEKMAEHMLNFFGYDDYIIDNVLTTTDRELVHMLEDVGIVTTERDEVKIGKSKVWRIHYWNWNKVKIRELAEKKPETKKETNDGTVYDSLEDDVWKRESAFIEKSTSGEAAAA